MDCMLFGTTTLVNSFELCLRIRKEVSQHAVCASRIDFEAGLGLWDPAE